MTLWGEFQTAVNDVLFDASVGRATSITYSPPSGGSTAISALINSGDFDENRGADDYGQTATIYVKISDIVLPVKKATVTVGGTNYKVIDATKTKSGFYWEIIAHKVG